MRISDWSSDVCSSDLYHRYFGFSINLKQGEWNPNMIIQVPAGSQGIKLPGQYRMQKFFGGRFSVGASDAHNRDVKLPAMMPGQVLQGIQHIRDQDTAIMDGIFRFIHNGK